MKINEEKGLIDIFVGDKLADHLFPEEALGVIAAILFTKNARCLNWLKDKNNVDIK